MRGTEPAGRPTRDADPPSRVTGNRARMRADSGRSSDSRALLAG
ncbi:hypothetical protein SXIM_49140 [Streptomyces xiamenensis]|uniref:Uncharacterized protein n=1 Tax=Streptomyces xiamenensis TaxID=408015 RepID=A0A0F7G007_9ACTN|nr:hypothetical protein SXIM_49140 [Streptomyces xiamenensis]